MTPLRSLAMTVCGYVYRPYIDPHRVAMMRRDVCDGRGPSRTWHEARIRAATLVRCTDTRTAHPDERPSP